MPGSAASDRLFPLLFVGPVMDSNTNKQTEEADAPPIASKLEQAIPDLTFINETAEQGECPAISAEAKHLENPVEDLIPKAENCNNQEKSVNILVLKEGNDPEKLVDTLNSKENGGNGIPTDKETKKDLSINDNIEGDKANISTDNMKNDNNQSFSKNHEAKDSESDKTIESNKPMKDRPKLTRGARKRFKGLLEKGHTPEEARRLAVIPTSANGGLKRIHGESSKSQPASKKTKTDPEKLDTLNSKEGEGNDKPTDKETKKDLSINDNIEDDEANISTDNIKNDNNQSSSKNHEAKDTESDKTIESNKPKKGRPRLTRGARKRFKWLLEKGHTPEEARRLAVIPTSANSGLKRILGENSKSQPTSKTKTFTPNTTQKNTSKGYIVPPSFSTPQTSTGCIKIGILSKKYPEELLTTEELKSIEATILERIVTQKEGEVKPKFLGTTFKLGFMIISCADRATSVWLKNAIDKIKPWEEASLVTVKEDKIPQAQILNAYFFNSIDDPNDKILGFIGAQNDGLNVGEWKVIQRKEDKIAVHLVFSADRKSVENLKKQDFKINYKFGQVHITLKETPVITQNTPIHKVEQKQAYSSKPNKRFRQPPPPKGSFRRNSWYSYGDVGSTSRIDPSIFYNR